MKLRLTVPLHADETAMSFVSRLAARNGAVNARSFCLDWGLRFQNVVNGDAATLATIARFGGIRATALQACAFVASGPASWTYRGEALGRPSLRRARIAICPACALSDIANAPDLKPRWAVYGRAAWLVDAVKTCPVHQIGLNVVSEDLTPGRLHDFALQVAPTIDRLPDLVDRAPKRQVGPLEQYVLGRLSGKHNADFLDGMPLHAAIGLCETVGSVILFGPKADQRSLPDDHWLAAGGRGYESLAGGPAALRLTLDALKSAAGSRSRQDGPSVAFGHIYAYLSMTRKEAGLKLARDTVIAYVRENFAIKAGRTVLGDRIKTRIKHSIHTLSKEAGIHPERLRKHIIAAGLVDEKQTALSDHNVIFDAAEGSRIAREIVSTLTLPEAREHLNISRSQMDVLLKHEFIAPYRPQASFEGYDRYAKADLDAFLAKLRRNARSVVLPPKRAANIPDAARQACCSAAEVVRLILDDRIEVMRLRSAHGYMALHVNVRQLLDAVRGPETGLSVRRVATLMRTSDRVVEALIKHKHLASYTAPNPMNRCPQVLVSPAEIARFEASFVSLHSLAKRLKRSPGRMRAELEAARIKPAFNPAQVRARFYRRAAGLTAPSRQT